jgi:poly-gamma-glutamate capsule biosynthesis protein CapA/YwtB (metallophosphatase superfamily)
LLFTQPFTILFLGDTHFGDNYQLNIELHGGENVIKKFGYDYFFKNVKGILGTSDFTFANLETPLSISWSISKEIYKHSANKDSTPFYLSKYGISAVTLANNHILDLGYEGMGETISSLNRYGIIPFGAGYNEEQASEPIMKKFCDAGFDNEIYVFGAYWYRSKFGIERNYYAKDDRGGVNMLDESKISAGIDKIREKSQGAFIIVYPHWGSNYKTKNDYQTQIAHKLIDLGVDLIIGHGAHTIQQIEYYNGRWIIYNIGNFIFNTPGKYESTLAKPYGFITELIIGFNEKILKIYPIFTNNLETNYQIRFLSEDEFDDCYKTSVSGKIESSKVKKSGYKYFEIQLN